MSTAANPSDPGSLNDVALTNRIAISCGFGRLTQPVAWHGRQTGSIPIEASARPALCCARANRRAETPAESYVRTTRGSFARSTAVRMSDMQANMAAGPGYLND